jgi:hypothetical protein
MRKMNQELHAPGWGSAVVGDVVICRQIVKSVSGLDLKMLTLIVAEVFVPSSGWKRRR